MYYGLCIMAYVVIAYVVTAYVVTVYIVMAYAVMAYIGMALYSYIVMVYAVMALYSYGTRQIRRHVHAACAIPQAKCRRGCRARAVSRRRALSCRDSTFRRVPLTTASPSRYG